jgi:hypothetical protein
MVAIVVAIAATVYVYTSNMMGRGTTIPTPTITFYRDEGDNTLTVLQGDPRIYWDDIYMNASDINSNYFDVHGLNGEYLTAGQIIGFDGNGLSGLITIKFIHISTNSLIGTYKLTGVSPT